MGFRISVVTPSYKQVDYLKLCARSVADQVGCFTHEHLIQDGGSGVEFEQWSQAQSFADCVSEADDGMYDAINRGFSRADGDVVAWLNCDEQYLPGTLEKVAVWFQEHPEKDLLFGDVVLVDPGGVPLAYRRAVVPWRGHVRSCFLPTYSAATFVRRKLIEGGHLLDGRFKAIADAVWIDGLLEQGFRGGVLNEPLATFTQTGENMGQSEAGIAEGRAWRGGKGSFIRKSIWTSLHRIRKFAVGAYLRRDISVRVFVPSSDSRVEQGASVGEKWRSH